MTSPTSGRTDAVIIWDRFEYTRTQLRSNHQVVIDAARTENDPAFKDTALLLLNALMEALNLIGLGEPPQEISAKNGLMRIAVESSNYRKQFNANEVNLNLKPFHRVPESRDVQSLFTPHSSEVSICMALNVSALQSQVVYFEMVADRELSQCKMASGGKQAKYDFGNRPWNVFPQLLDLRSCHQDRTMGMKFMLCWMAKQPQDGEDTSRNTWCNVPKPLSDIK